MNFVDEKDGAAAQMAVPFRVRHNRFDFFDAAQNGAERNELRAGGMGDDARERGLTDAGRSPQDDARHAILFDLPAQRFTRTQD